MHVPDPVKPFVEPPVRPEGAEWAAPPKVVTRLVYRADGEGYLRDGHTHLFVLSADGGAPRPAHRRPVRPRGPGRLDAGRRLHPPLREPARGRRVRPGEHRGLRGRRRRREGPRPDEPKRARRLSRRLARRPARGLPRLRRRVPVLPGDPALRDEPRRQPAAVSHRRGWTATSSRRSGPATGRGSTSSTTTRARPGSPSCRSRGASRRLADGVGGTSLDRPYSGGSFSVSSNGRIAFTLASPDRPAEVALLRKDAPGTKRLVRLNEELLGHRTLGRLEELRWKSSKDGRAIQGWVMTPPGFDPSRKYPLILEIHGGPVANYGPRFAAELQLFAAAGYVVALREPARQRQLRRRVRQPDPPRLPGRRLLRPDVGRRRRDRQGLRGRAEPLRDRRERRVASSRRGSWGGRTGSGRRWRPSPSSTGTASSSPPT